MKMIIEYQNEFYACTWTFVGDSDVKSLNSDQMYMFIFPWLIFWFFLWLVLWVLWNKVK